jgi:radical SAM protein with 4Fe4S-binding SPASM domain
MVRPTGTQSIPEGLLDRFFTKDKMFRRYAVRNDTSLQNGCSSLYKTAVIYWNGDVTTCCHDSSGLNYMGNVFEADSLMALWNGPRYRALRRQVNSNISRAKPLCCVCPARVVVQADCLSKGRAA